MTTAASLHKTRIERQEQFRQLYAFQPADPKRLCELSKTELWMSDPEKFNDPLDVRLTVKDLTDRGPFKEEHLRQAMRLLIDNTPEKERYPFYSKSLIAALERWIDGVTIFQSDLGHEISVRCSEFGMRCFTPIWNNFLMWSHYASAHKGFCVEYCIRPLDLAGFGNREFLMFDVQYTSQLPELCLSEVLFSPHQALERLLATKRIEWAYEQECRLVHLNKKAACVAMPSECMEISALIAGLEMAPAFLEQLKKKASSLGIPAYQMVRKHGEVRDKKPLE